MSQTSASLSPESRPDVGVTGPEETLSNGYRSGRVLPKGIRRRWSRVQRRRRVGRAYDMALEIARVIPPDSRVLDVGCGRGFVAHHLSAILGTKVMGIDLHPAAETAIDYFHFNGREFPIADESVDAVLFCYVLHHAQDLGSVMSELRRVLSEDGLAVIYEDIPATWWDRLFCKFHNLKWRNRTGACTFHSEYEWRSLFNSNGFAVVTERRLSRWRNFVHPVCRTVFVVIRSEPKTPLGA